jgi:hypothetical protein
MHYGIRKLLYLHYGFILLEGTAGPAPRDDIERLGYSLLHLAIGDLPWMYNVRHRTRKAQYDQVLIIKNSDTVAPTLPLMGYLASVK